MCEQMYRINVSMAAFERLKSMWGKKLPRTYFHPVYGNFEAEAGEQCWTAKFQHDGVPFALSIPGSDTQPDPSRFDAVARALAQFATLRESALDFIVREQPHAQRHEFTPKGLDFGCVSGLDPQDFEFEFARRGDVDGIWRVVFRSGVPAHLGRDS